MSEYLTSDSEMSSPLFNHLKRMKTPLHHSFEETNETTVLLGDFNHSDEDSSKFVGYRTISRASSVIPFDPVTLIWEQLTVSGSTTSKGRMTRILSDMTGAVEPGQMLALMGASGSGKTTLMNVLNQRNMSGLDMQGRVSVNGLEMGRDITSISAYVQQDDLFIGTLTVREHLTFQAQFRLAASLSQAFKKVRVDEVIVDLGLKKCQNTRIGKAGWSRGISGGEAKRLAFASEFLTNPSLFFCDEPTSGLDSFMAESVVNVLKRLADSGKTVICTIHQPASEIYILFDRVLFLADGRTAYFGATNEALSFFSSCGFNSPKHFNPADFIIQTLAIIPNQEIECRERVKTICDQYDQSEYALSAEKMVIQKVIMGLFVGLLYLNTKMTQKGVANINGALFYVITELTYTTIFGILMTMPADFPLVVREHHNGMYSVGAYYLAKTLSYVPLFSLDGLLLLSISYFMIGLRPTIGAFFITALIAFCVEQSAASCGVMIGTISTSYPIAVAIAGPLLTILSLTGGLFANIGTLPTYISWMQYTSWFRYGYEALLVNQWKSIDNITCVVTDFACFQNGDDVLTSFSFETGFLWPDIALLFACMFVFYFVGYLGLAIRVYRSR